MQGTGILCRDPFAGHFFLSFNPVYAVNRGFTGVKEVRADMNTGKVTGGDGIPLTGISDEAIVTYLTVNPCKPADFLN